MPQKKQFIMYFYKHKDIINYIHSYQVLYLLHKCLQGWEPCCAAGSLMWLLWSHLGYDHMTFSISVCSIDTRRTVPHPQSYPWSETFTVCFLSDAELTISIILKGFVIHLQETCRSWGYCCCCIRSKDVPPPAYLVPMVTHCKTPSHEKQLIASTARELQGITKANKNDSRSPSPPFKPAV